MRQSFAQDGAWRTAARPFVSRLVVLSCFRVVLSLSLSLGQGPLRTPCEPVFLEGAPVVLLVLAAFRDNPVLVDAKQDNG